MARPACEQWVFDKDNQFFCAITNTQMWSVRDKILAVIGRYRSLPTVPRLNTVQQNEERSSTGVDVSIIVPVFNKADYLEQCLDSLLQQSLRNIEVICVDDASTDNSRNILETYARTDARISVIKNTENLGAGLSRNKGIEAAKGDFLQFMDADDLLTPESLEVLHATAVDDDVDLVKGELAVFRNDTPQEHRIVSTIDRKRKCRPLEQKELWIPWWHTAYLISRQLVLEKGIRYPDLRKGEDPVFLASILVNARSLSTVPIVTYYYRERAGGEDRITVGELYDYLKHASMVKSILSGHNPACWKHGYGPFLLRHIKGYIDTLLPYLSVDQATFFLSEIETVWEQEISLDSLSDKKFEPRHVS